MAASLSSTTFVLFAVFVLTLSGVVLAQQNACKSTARGQCYCDLADGKGIISLQNLAAESNKQPFATRKDKDTSYFMVFCGLIQGADLDQCDNKASLCEVNSGGGNYNLGEPATLRYELRTNDQHSTESLALVMDAPDAPDGVQRRTVGFLNCEKNTGSLAWKDYGYNGDKDADGYLIYYADFTHKDFCEGQPVPPPPGPDGGLSPGSVLDIIFFSLLFAYFVGGFVFMTFVKHAQGQERIPNVYFWTSLPGLAKEGFFFSWNMIKLKCCTK